MRINLNELSCGYNGISILENINISFESGQWYFLIGTSGSGKSTLLHTISGMLKKIDGEILVNSNSLSEKNILRQFREEIGIMFQYTEKQFFNHSVRDEIIYTLKRKKIDPIEIENRLSSILELLSISKNLLDKSPFELSGGQKRTVALASVLINNPKLLILDEPTVGLDIENKEIFLKTLKKLRDNGMLIIQSCHILEDAAEYADHVIVLSKRNIVAQGKPEYILLSREILQDAMLEPPEILELYEIFSKFGFNLPKTTKIGSVISTLLGGINGK
jgi:energy-coupling factor transport system ATP-binding protein